MKIKKIKKLNLELYDDCNLDKFSELSNKLNEVIKYLNNHILMFQNKKEVVVIIDNWYKYDKIEWLSAMKSALNDIEINNGENLVDILEDYYETVELKIQEQKK